MTRLALVAAVLSLAAASPAGACAADDSCLEDALVAVVEGETWVDYDADGLRDGDEHDRAWSERIFADYNRDGERQNGETLAEVRPDGSYTLPVDTRRLDGNRVDVRYLRTRFADNPGVEQQCTGRAPGCVVSLELRAGETRGAVDFPRVASALIRGLVWDDKNEDGRRQAGEDGVPGLRVFLDDDRDGRFGAGELWARSLADGTYGLPIPTRYQAAGRSLPPLVVEPATGAVCSAPRECAVTSLRTRSTQTTTAAHGVSRPVVIFIHGYGGSRITCPERTLWVNPAADLRDLRLGRDGRNLRASDGGSFCSQNARVDGLIENVAGYDIYGKASQHFDDITWPGRHFDYVWDWRTSPEDGADLLDDFVERARCGGSAGCATPIVARVQLIAHSQGGLVLRHYINRPDRAAKVQRAVAVGAPYLGSPKAIFALAAGIQAPNFAPIDLFTDSSELKAAVRTFPGHFSLLPAFGYGDWLAVSGVNGGRPLDVDGVETYLRRIGVDGSLYIRSASEHVRVLDHYSDHGVDFHVIAGGGLPTIGGVALRYGLTDEAEIRWVSGDATVPAFAAAADTPRDRLHYVCGIAHTPIAAAPEVTRLIDGFLLGREEIRDQQPECDWRARELSVYTLRNLSEMAGSASSDEPRVVAGGQTLSLRAAERGGLVQVVRVGASVKIVSAAGGADVRVELPKGATARVREVSEKGAGPERRFGPLGAPASVDLGGSGAVTSRGKSVRPAARDSRPPVTRARVKRAASGRFRLSLRARDASRVAATYVVVAGKRRLYTRPVVLSAKRLAKVTYGSVDVWGNAERPRRAPRP